MAVAKTTGVVLVFLDERGHAIAHAADFDKSKPAGFSLREAQRRRAERSLAFAVCAAYASPMLVRGMDWMDCERVLGRLCQQHGCTVQEVAVGHEVGGSDGQ